VGEDRVAAGARVDCGIVLVEPRNAGNVGLVARTMANFGLSRLVLAGPTELPAERDQLAARAEGRPILDALTRTDTLAAALADEQVLVAVTRRVGRYRPSDVTPATLPAFLDGLPEGTRVAFVFGREATGLTNEEAELCPHALRIPTAPEAPSLNLAQAVAVVAATLYAREEAAGRTGTRPGRGLGSRRGVVRGAPESVPALRSDPAAADDAAIARQREFREMMVDLDDVLRDIGFLGPPGDDVARTQLERLLGRIHPTRREVRFLRGLASRIRLTLRRSGVEDSGR
jgi:TrmH family RNA methyltransferase